MLSSDIGVDLISQHHSRIEAALEELVAAERGTSQETAMQLASQVLLAGGKRLRPILVMLAYEMAGGDDLQEVLPLALAFELIHTATLVHDDINDNAKLRRGVQTIHAKHSSVEALIAGDYLFVLGFGLGGRYPEPVVKRMADCCAEIAAAELKQLTHIYDLATTPEDYYQVILGKTAGPFSAGCAGAAMVAGANPEQVQAFSEYGAELGSAFQIVDDLLDLLGDQRMGKPRGTDVLEGKMTLPLIHGLTLLHGEPRRRLAEVIENFHSDLWGELIDLLEQAGSLDYARQLGHNHITRAVECLQIFGDSEIGTMLQELTLAVMDRDV
jgi:geranylgeranyl pyrophosphate synthase